MKLAIFGAGGIGGYLGARLADVGHEVHLVARGAHLEAIRADGLRVESVHGDTAVDLPATDDPGTIGPCDVVPFCVKTYDTRAAAAQLDPLVDEDTAIISFQNGVDNERWIADAVGEEHVAAGIVQIFSTIAAPGVIEHTGGPARYVYGELDGRRTDRMEAFHGAMTACEGLEGVLADDAVSELWRKFAFICAQSGMTTATRQPVGRLRETPASWAMYRRMVEEVVAVAQARGVDLPDATVDDLLEFAESLEGDMYSSLHYDMTHGNRMELEALQGAVVDHGRATGVDVPMHEAVTAVLQPVADANREGSG